MYRCYICKEPVTKIEQWEVQGIFGKFTEGEIANLTRDLGDNDLFDKEGYVVICMNCMIDTDIEVENLVFKEVEE